MSNTLDAERETSSTDATAAFRRTVEAAGVFPRNGPDPSARSWGHSSSGVTFAAQTKLPKLPLPSLESCCQMYLEVVKPLQSAEEHEKTTAAVETFRTGEGQILQAQLQEYDRTHANFMENFWYEYFLNDDSSVVLNSNAFCTFADDPDQSRNDQVTRAASLVRSTVAFSQAILTDRLPPDDIRGTPLCSHQYWWLFGTSRVPAEDGGRIRHNPDSKHIIVLCRGQLYSLDVLDVKISHIFGEQELSRGLQSILDDAAATPIDKGSKTAIGLLTTGNQKAWSRCRMTLIHGGLENGRNFGVVDSALFALCLDDNSPEAAADVCKNMICGTNIIEKSGAQVGTCINRWYDKLSIIVCRNGKAGMNFEHTCTDGSVDIRMACDIYKGSILPSAGDGGDGVGANGASSLPENGEAAPDARRVENGTAVGRPEKLRWDIGSEVQEALSLAETHLAERIERHQLEPLEFHEYGKKFMTSVGFSPDAYFQMALQAAYCSLHGRVENGFEPVQMRQYLHGRTDVVRTTTFEAKEFAQAFCNRDASAHDKIQAMHRAAGTHVALSKRIAAGGGHHRHLFVLNQMWKRRRAFLEAASLAVGPDGAQANGTVLQTPAETIFTDPGWNRLGSTILMGSNVDNPNLTFAGFGPAGDDAFTVCYFIRADYLALTVCCRNGRAKPFVEAIRNTLVELRKLLEPREQA